MVFTTSVIEEGLFLANDDVHGIAQIILAQKKGESLIMSHEGARRTVGRTPSERLKSQRAHGGRDAVSGSTSNLSSCVSKLCRENSIQQSTQSLWHWLCICPSRLCLCPASRGPWVQRHQRVSACAPQQSHCIVLTNASMTPILTSSYNVFPNLCSYSHVPFPSLDCFSRLQDRLGTFQL